MHKSFDKIHRDEEFSEELSTSTGIDLLNLTQFQKDPNPAIDSNFYQNSIFHPDYR